jgi:hypothetical protein
MSKKAGAERIASAFATTGGPNAAVDALEELRGGRKSGHPERTRHTGG